MAINPDDGILKDFLVEAGEILERLNNELVMLESHADDKELLNSIFRGFHTIKGGAGFLAITPLVEICHCTEDIFNALRKDERAVDAGLMDVVLASLDVVNVMFNALRSGQDPEAADPALVTSLRGLLKPPAAAARPASAAPVAPTPAVASAASPPPSSTDDITDQEFEALLDQLHGTGKGPGVVTVAPAPPAAIPMEPEEISVDEFEALLDTLHGKGQAPGAGNPAAAATPNVPAEVPVSVASAPAAGTVAAKSAPARAEPAKPEAETTVRVDTQKLDDIMNMVGELVLARNRLVTLQTVVQNEELSRAVANVDVVTTDLQIAVMKTRMLPINKVFGRFPRVVRDLARQLKKEVNLELVGEETDLDKNMVEALADPLVHLVRNSVDHGVEMPDVRAANGKPRAGRVLLSAAQEGDRILITIEDDGGGMDAEVLRRKAVEKGLYDEAAAARLTREECFNIIFLPGFSTKAVISDVSGRGVGMDVVRTKIASLNGMVNIDSELGRGTRILIRLPLTLAILPALMVIVSGQIFALPLSGVAEILSLDMAETSVVDGQLVALVRDRTLPLFYLRRWLTHDRRHVPRVNMAQVVVVHNGSNRIGFIVDALVGQEEVVIKPLGAMLHGVQGLAGATITGEGRIALILDVPGMIRSNARRDTPVVQEVA